MSDRCDNDILFLTRLYRLDPAALCCNPFRTLEQTVYIISIHHGAQGCMLHVNCQLDTDGEIWPQPLMIDTLELTDFNPVLESRVGEDDDDAEDEGLTQESYLKYLTWVTASEGKVYLAGTFYGSLGIHGHEIHSESAKYVSSDVVGGHNYDCNGDVLSQYGCSRLVLVNHTHAATRPRSSRR
eukprot:scaffold143341_cov41-Prasinocladus_malaysianus.AAC.3